MSEDLFGVSSDDKCEEVGPNWDYGLITKSMNNTNKEKIVTMSFSQKGSLTKKKPKPKPLTRRKIVIRKK